MKINQHSFFSISRSFFNGDMYCFLNADCIEYSTMRLENLYSDMYHKIEYTGKYGFEICCHSKMYELYYFDFHVEE